MTDTDDDLAETRAALLDRVRQRFGRIDPARIVDHVLRATEDADFAVRKAALDALARRFSFAARDGVEVVASPAGRTRLGSYAVGRRADRRTRSGKAAPGYVTAVLELEPLRTSCACADFVRSSLGLCKHGLIVLDRLARAGKLGSGEVVGAEPGLPPRACVTWSPLHPLLGPADRLARVAVAAPARRAPPALEHFADGKPLASALRDPGGRLALIAGLERAIARGRIDAEPAVATILTEERARAERALEGRAVLADAAGHLRSLRRQLYPYQRQGVRRFLEQGRMLLADDMGLGKTTQAIACCHALFEAGRVDHGLLIVPAALRSQWKREWEATSRVPVTVIEGSPAERAALYRRRARGFLIVGYELFLRDFEHLRALAPDLVVLDEAQRIKNWATKSATFVKALPSRYRLVLTGTPMENRFEELASIMDFVDDVALEPKWRLVPWHSESQGDAGSGVSGARNLDTLRARLSPVMLRRVRSEVLKQLPSRTDTRVPVELTAAQQVEHDELRQPISMLLAKARRRPLTQGEFLQLMQLLTLQRMICNGLAQVHFEEEWPRIARATPTPALLEGLHAPKLGALCGVLEQVVVAQRRKAVVFSQWRSMLRLCEWPVRGLLAGAGQRAVFFTGAESSKLRERAIVDFHDDPSVGVMFLSDAGGVGLNLQRAASGCVNLELPWNPAVLEQRIGRIYRLGQTKPIDVYNLVSEAGIESRIAQLVANKKAVFSSLFDGTSDEVRFEGGHSFLEGVKKLVDAPDLPESTGEAEGDDELDLVAGSSPSSTPSSTPSPPPDRQGAATSDAEALGSGLALGATSLLSKLSLTRLPDGGLRIDTPKEAAVPLAELLEGLARSLRAGALPPG